MSRGLEKPGICRETGFLPLNPSSLKPAKGIKLFKTATPAVVGILIVNVLLFAWKMLSEPANPRVEANPVDELLALHFPYNDRLGFWQYVTHIFMHGHLAHIAFNMFGVFTFGSILERVWGTKRFLIFYFAAGIGAAVIHTGVNIYEFGTYVDYLATKGVSAESIQMFLDFKINLPYLTVEEAKAFRGIYWGSMLGASGALYGVLVAFALLFPNAKLALIFLPVPVAAKYFVPVLILIDLLSIKTGFSLFGGGIAHVAHVGGALIGFLLMLYWKKSLPRYRYE
ncbi:rhomboid family intramembrane serine protease [Pelagicoccus mobilis]|uniref:Rhomboid family intramembrane serine protease n=1 Tax=Pelagicoccus mobilis TaxID=415221 RepID=A0A934S2K7_9BACT|nr:rhomboid family intramembrane serine protease [Pelagicoccus mobilis]MBK1878682.1 rhomboid family intramembrane serine protease [Pelagicoccus mobilis]